MSPWHLVEPMTDSHEPRTEALDPIALTCPTCNSEAATVVEPLEDNPAVRDRLASIGFIWTETEFYGVRRWAWCHWDGAGNAPPVEDVEVHALLDLLATVATGPWTSS